MKSDKLIVLSKFYYHSLLFRKCIYRDIISGLMYLKDSYFGELTVSKLKNSFCGFVRLQKSQQRIPACRSAQYANLIN